MALAASLALQVTGGVTGVPSYPGQPEGSPWHSDPVPKGEPLGYSINQMTEDGTEGSGNE